MGFLEHGLRNLTHTATLAFTALKAGTLGVTGATGEALERTLIGLRTLVDRSVADVRVAAGLPPPEHPRVMNPSQPTVRRSRSSRIW